MSLFSAILGIAGGLLGMPFLGALGGAGGLVGGLIGGGLSSLFGGGGLASALAAGAQGVGSGIFGGLGGGIGDYLSKMGIGGGLGSLGGVPDAVGGYMTGGGVEGSIAAANGGGFASAIGGGSELLKMLPGLADGGGGGGGIGGMLSQLGTGGGVPLTRTLGGLYGLSESLRLQRMAKLPSPGEVTSLPGYEAGMEAVRRSMASQGYQGSGNMMAAMAKYGGDFYNQAVGQRMQSAEAQAGGVGGALSSLALLGSGLRGF